jgi:catechol 2,3-dioxygenase-like lactoylglutathione lyase family enzyme
MTSGNVQVTFDCADPAALATFWAAVLGYPPPDIDGTHAVLRALGQAEETLGDWYRIEDPNNDGPRLAFQRVPEHKTTKNRVHLDVQPRDSTLQQEVERVLALGATQLETVTDEAGTFVILQDPEGNEFCIG